MKAWHGLALLLTPCVSPATPTVVADYMLNCQGCHLPDGSGFAAHGVPDLKFSATLVSLPGGREYLVRVPGVAQSGLDDARLAALLNWTLASFGGSALPADFRPYSASEISGWRRDPYADPAAVRRQLLERVSQQQGPRHTGAAP